MLYEIKCDEFKQKVIKFHNGLNTVLGTSAGDNSIGKSTFLLVVDFAFGGTTYATSEDLIKNIGDHNIYFTYIFDNVKHKFCRNTTHYREVEKCDDDYNTISKIKLVDFCSWLKEMYLIQVPDISFRKIVDGYIRVYGKNNANEKLPLHSFPEEKMQDAIYTLLKHFNMYAPIKQIATQAAESTEALKSFLNAQKLEFIDSISKRDYEKNKKVIQDLGLKISDLCTSVEHGFADLDLALSEDAIKTKNILSNARRLRSKLESRLNAINNDSEYKFSATTEDLSELKSFFPEANIAKLETIEQFHYNISNIFKREIAEEKRKLNYSIQEYNKIILKCEQKLNELIGSTNITKSLLVKHAELVKELENLKRANSNFETLVELKNDKANDTKELLAIQQTQLVTLAANINAEMKSINDEIYDGKFNSPILSFNNKSYDFITPNDTGTGIAYKGLVVFDLAVLHLSQLPLLVHDSIVLKQISDFAIEKILDIYDRSGKQVIISLDKQDSYSPTTEKILTDKSVLSLSSNGNQLFGRSWGQTEMNLNTQS